MTNAWSHGLIQAIHDPRNILIKNSQLVVIRDKFPKAKHHFLVIPFENIDTIYELKKCDIPLVNEMALLAQNAIETTGLPTSYFRIGFHAVPSMKRYKIKNESANILIN